MILKATGARQVIITYLLENEAYRTGDNTIFVIFLAALTKYEILLQSKGTRKTKNVKI